MAKTTFLDPSRIVYDRLSARTDFYPEVHAKRQIFLHHTVSHPNPAPIIKAFRTNPVRSAPCILIAGMPYPRETSYRDGDIFSAFPSKYWAMHLHAHAAGNRIPLKYKNREHTRVLERNSIGISLCNFGPLTYESGRFYSSFRTIVPEEQVIEYVHGYRKHRFYHKYTQAQLDSLRRLLLQFCHDYNIAKTYHPDMWDINVHALKGDEGIFTHASVRSDVTDCHPQPELVRLLVGLAKDPGPDSDPRPIAAAQETAPDPAEEQAPEPSSATDEETEI